MERENRKRTREEEKEKQKTNKEKKAIFECSKENGRGFYAGSGIFEFPWLKEGFISKRDEFLEIQDTFGPCSYMQDEMPSIFTANLDQFSLESLWVRPSRDQNFGDDYKIDENNLSTAQEPGDCIWSSITDQPLDIGFNQG